MGLVLSFIFVLLGLNEKKSKGLFFLFSLFLVVLFGFNSWTVDRSIYLGRYEFFDEDYFADNTEFLFTFLMNFLNNLGLDFQFFLFLSGLFFTTSLCFYVYKTTLHINYVLSLYLLSVFLFNICLLRVSISFILVIPAFYFYIFRRDNIGFFLFVLLILLASSFHMMCICYLVILPARYIPSNKLLMLSLIFAFVAIFSLFFIKGLVLEYSSFVGMNEKLNKSLDVTSETSNPIVAFILAAFRWLSVVLQPLIFYKILSTSERINLKETDIVIININLILISFVPFLFLSHDLYRMTFVIFLVNLCMMSNYIKIKKVKYLMFFLSINVAYWFIWRPYFIDVYIRPMLNNLVFGEYDF